ncbi:MAG: exodeoxyribonuclease VII large subunit [bacterium]|nr:exodeoxyribonuclease VII large subunit [bacterium]
MEDINIAEKVFTISEYIALLNIGLKRSGARIIGEVAEVKAGPTGHVYFSLKDESNGNVISCIIWKSRYFLYGIRMEEGMKIIAQGSPQIYAPTGRFSFIADTIQHAGEGELKKEYERLKKKLEEEGVFAPEKKRPLPAYIQNVGVITSMKGAVIADFSNNLKKFGFRVKIIDSRVEGQAAVQDILLSLKNFRSQDIDVLAVMRGGGSLESMMAFNNEAVVREIANFPVPIIAGIGHHKDQPLAAMAADISVSTPTAAANAISESWQRALLYLERMESIILRRFEDILSIGSDMKENLRRVLSSFESVILRVKQNIRQTEEIINVNNPERQLRLGYCLTFCRGKLLKTVKGVKIGDNINVKMADGEIESKINKIK